ncbi:MAG: glycosyltransferase family 2 protein [Actinomycetia bacterium]|nr:glycosyltransferase family 2 protein [Actinomycetes bacterium]
MTASAPRVSVILPVLNEEDELDEALQRIASQSYQDFEVLVADGGSCDATCRIVEEWCERDPRFQLLHNPRKLQSAGLNTALTEARGEYLVRLDGHSFIEDDYVERCVELLDTTGAEVAGGRMVPVPGSSPVARGIALANQSPWGAGPARFHTGGESGPAETVYLGSFRTDRVWELGGWSENVGVNEDYELNHRIRRAGGVVWLDIDLATGYRPRGSFRALTRQYARYGRSKATVMRRHPDSARLRQVLPALLAPALLGMGSRRLRPLVTAMLLFHATLVVLGAVRSPSHSPPDRAAGSLAAWLMHWSWSIGFWWGVVSPFPAAGESP